MKCHAVSLRRLLQNACFVDCDDIQVTQVRSDSRAIVPGDVFVAVEGTTVDGHNYLSAAIANGARAVVTQHPVSDLSVPQCVVPCSAKALATIAMAVCGDPAASMTNVGITGTNGKTTTSFLLHSILQQAGASAGLIGTIENSDGFHSQPANMTTPSAEDIASHFAGMCRQKTSHSVLEISSHALTQKRCAAIPLSAAVITNITQDHFDYHRTPEAYREAKSQIASLLYPDAPLLLNGEDPDCRQVMSQLSSSVPVITFGIDCDDAELQAKELSRTHRSQRIQLELAQGSAEVRLRLIGRHNVMNSLAAAGLAEQLGVRLKHIVAGLESVHCVPGRLERISEDQPFQVLVDYAHTPDALSHTIRTIRDFVPGRVICVFGAGGDRDRLKRPLMGAAAQSADLAIVTSDNPRSESPQGIINDVVDGFPRGMAYLTEVDRRCAIARAFEAAELGDAVLIAGKGHECTQEIAGRSVPFDDRNVARQLLRECAATGGVDALTPVFSLPKAVRA